MTDQRDERTVLDDSPPLFRSWNVWYALVLGNLVLLIVLFYLFTRAFGAQVSDFQMQAGCLRSTMQAESLRSSES